MNSFLFKALFLFFILISPALHAQSGNNSSDPLHPLCFLADSISSEGYLQISYLNPLGIKSIQDFRINYQGIFKSGNFLAGLRSFGIRGYSQYAAEFGYALELKSKFYLGLTLHSDFLPRDASGRYKVYSGSSLFSSISLSNQLLVDIHLRNWTQLWFRSDRGVIKPCLSVITRINGSDRINVISGLNYTIGFSPVFRAGVSIIANQKHTIIAGLQSSPGGFWFGYSFELERIKFLITMQSGGAFGYEPGSSLKYFLK